MRGNSKLNIMIEPTPCSCLQPTSAVVLSYIISPKIVIAERIVRTKKIFLTMLHRIVNTLRFFSWTNSALRQ